MSFKLLLYAPDGHPEHSLFKWRDRLEMEIPGIEVDLVTSEDEAIEAISSADAAFGNISSEIFVRDERLRWVACPQAGQSFL